MAVSSSRAVMAVAPGAGEEVDEVDCSQRRCEEGGIPVMGRSLVLRWEMVQVGVMRRSDEELGERIWRETSEGGKREAIS